MEDPTPQLWSLSAPDGEWEVLEPLPQPRWGHRLVSVGGRLFAVGGRDGDRELTTRVDVYDPELDAWRAGPALPAPTSAAAMGVVDGRIHVVDGEDPATFTGGVLDEHWVLAPDEEIWEQGPPSRLAVHGAADGVIGDRLHIVGGATRQGALSVLSWTDQVQVLDPGE